MTFWWWLGFPLVVALSVYLDNTSKIEGICFKILFGVWSSLYYAMSIQYIIFALWSAFFESVLQSLIPFLFQKCMPIICFRYPAHLQMPHVGTLTAVHHTALTDSHLPVLPLQSRLMAKKKPGVYINFC